MNTQKKSARYERIYQQLKKLLTASSDPIARMSTINAVLHHKMDDFFWTGFYLLTNEGLVVGPYQGPVACQILEKNKGVCWAAINSGKTIIVKNIHDFPGHIACDSRSLSEIAVPLRSKAGEIIGVLDIDSKKEANFDEIDADHLEKIIDLL
jgi:L-methionine (R)-S-oxide reductase